MDTQRIEKPPMMMTRKIRSIALAMALAATLSAAPVASGQTVMLSSSVNCTLWPKTRNTPVARATVNAYMTALSVSYWKLHTGKVGEHGLDPLAALSSPEEAYGWIDGYCAKNPDDPLALAMDSLFSELEARRRLVAK